MKRTQIGMSCAHSPQHITTKNMTRLHGAHNKGVREQERTSFLKQFYLRLHGSTGFHSCGAD